MSLRDLLLTTLLVGGLPFALRRPFVGALIFAIVSLANPHRFTWGFAYSMPWAMAYAAATIAAVFFVADKQVADSVRRYLPMLAYLAWMSVTTWFALERTDAVPRLVAMGKVHLMCLVTLCLVTDWKRLKQLVWVAVGSIAFFGLKGGIFTLLTGGRYLVWGPPDSAIQDNNHLAVGLVMMLPLLYWLYTTASQRWVRMLLFVTALSSIASVFGSHSRSAFLGIGAMTVFLVLKTKQRMGILFVALVVGAGIAGFMPASYWTRMGTIAAYQEDRSAMGRINVWRTAIRIANDRITGAGFEYYGERAFRLYAPDPKDIHSSHSIYFQALGEHGWPGFALFAFIWLYIWRSCRQVIRRPGSAAEAGSRQLLARMLQTSIVGFAVGGAFVNIGNWDMAYYLAIAALANLRLAQADTVRLPRARRSSKLNEYQTSVSRSTTGSRVAATSRSVLARPV